jgi:hypothetical protein
MTVEHFPRPGDRVTDSLRTRSDVLTVESIDYATGVVNLSLAEHAAPYPYGRPCEGGTLTYSRHIRDIRPA